MKTYLKISILSTFLLAASCSSSFLEVPLQGLSTAETDPNLAQNLVIGVYNSLLLGEAFGAEGDAHGLAFVTATNIISDDADKGSTASDQAATVGVLDNFTLTPTNLFVQSLWAGHYNGIAKANNALKIIEKATFAETEKAKLMAEVRFIRAYYYFNLVRWYGGVPKILRVPINADDANADAVFQTRASATEIYNVITDDLNYAAANLPLRNQTQVGRIAKGTAQALLAKVYLYQKQNDKAYTLATEVINSGQYALIDNYAQLWRHAGNNSKESVFEIQTGTFNNSDYGVNAYAMFQGPRVGGKGGWRDLGWGFCTPSTQLVNSYEPGDKRKDASIIFIDNSGKGKGTILYDGFRLPSADSVENLRYNYKAYHSENPNVEPFLGNRDLKQKNLHLLRYADVLLIAAEAANELGKPTEALTYLNAIRTRAGLAASTAAAGTPLRQAIWQERHIELALEHDRWFDLARTNQAAPVMQAAGKSFIAGKHELLPIPALQIALSGGKLVQNPNY
jgi:starch-binding outer membrane protein, SusD/RagB family